MALIKAIQAEIEARALPNGGWTSGTSGRAAIETTCYALMALKGREGSTRDDAIELLLRTQNPDGSWPAFDGDDPEGCWTTALVTIAFRFVGFPSGVLQKPIDWLVKNRGREGHWFWRWKFRTVDRAVQINADKFGWSWFPGTVSWVIPTAFALIALKQSFHCCRTKGTIKRIQIGTEMLRDRACPQGGWNAGNGIVFGSALIPHIDATAIALLALTDDTDETASRGREWLRQSSADCSSYSLAWSALTFLIHHDEARNLCIAKLHKALSTQRSIFNVETLGLAAIVLKAADGGTNPFQTVI